MIKNIREKLSCSKNNIGYQTDTNFFIRNKNIGDIDNDNNSYETSKKHERKKSK